MIRVVGDCCRYAPAVSCNIWAFSQPQFLHTHVLQLTETLENPRGTEPACMESMHDSSFRSLEVWQHAMTLTDQIYDLTKGFPRHELYGLTSQLRRAAVRIPSNIAEGSRQKTPKGKASYYINARGSAAEIETQLEVSRRRKYAAEAAIRPAEELASRLGQMLRRLIESTEIQ
jgi:four helix bundle protein